MERKTWTTNLHETGRSSPRRAHLETWTGPGSTGRGVWVTLYDCWGNVIGVGPTVKMLPAGMREDAQARMDSVGDPLYWRTEEPA